MTPRVLVLELNELCPPLLDRYMQAGDLPNLSRLHEESITYVTDAEELQDRLNPWVQWVTAHTGVGFEEHRVFKLGEGASLTLPTVADAVGGAERTSWLCGPMNVVPVTPVKGCWLPDPWNPDDARIPPALAPFAAFVRANVQEHTNESHRLGPRAYLGFLGFMVRHGLSLATVAATVSQVVGERVGRTARWRRAALLDRFQWDMFRHRWKRTRPTFATYFSNTTAHYQHLYWRHMDPDSFDLKPTPAEIATYGDAIRSGYVEMDRLVGAALDLVDDDTTLVLCTAISQQPYLLKDADGGSRFYRPHDIESFVRSLGIDGFTKVAPVMAAQYHLLFPSEETAAAAESILAGATVGSQPAFGVRRVGPDVFTGFAIVHDLPRDAVIDVPATGRRVTVHDALYRSETAKSGYHHPEGAFWIRSPQRTGVDVSTRVSLRAVAPTLLRLLGIEPPPSMRTPALPIEPAAAAQAAR